MAEMFQNAHTVLTMLTGHITKVRLKLPQTDAFNLSYNQVNHKNNKGHINHFKL